MTWSAIFHKAWQLTGQNIVSFAALLAAQVGALLLLTPTITSYSMQMDVQALSYGVLPVFDATSSSFDVLYLILGLFLALVSTGYFLSAARGKANLDTALGFDRQIFWNFLWLCLMMCGAAVLWTVVNVLIFGAGALSMVAASVMEGPRYIDGPFADIGGLIGAMSWPILGGLVLVAGVILASLAWAFAPFLVVEGAGPFAALQKSWRMSYGHRWLTLFLNILPGLAAGAVIVFFLILTALVALMGFAWLTGFLAAISTACAVVAFVLAAGVKSFGLAVLYVSISKR